MAKHLVITGATRGIGAALVAAFAQEGWVVSGCGRDAEAVAAAKPATGAGAWSALDVTVVDDVQAWADAALATAGAPDLLINNAGLINRNAPLWEVPPAEFQAVIRTNLEGPFNVIRAFVPTMIEAGRGVIVNLSSGWGRSTSPEVAPYCTSKWGIEGMTRALSQELPTGMAAVALNPGVIDTRMLRSCFGEGAEGVQKPAAWAERAMPLLLGLTAEDNGQALTVD